MNFFGVVDTMIYKFIHTTTNDRKYIAMPMYTLSLSNDITLRLKHIISFSLNRKNNHYKIASGFGCEANTSKI